MSGKILYELSAHAVIVAAENRFRMGFANRVLEHIALSAIVWFGTR